MKNHWLDEKKKKRLMEELDDAMMEAWGNDMTLGQLLESLTEEQYDFMMDMELDCPNFADGEIGITLLQPE